MNRTKVAELQEIEYCDIQQKISDNKQLASPVTTVVFDIETTGFSSGGENSTLQTFINPQRYVKSALCPWHYSPFGEQTRCSQDGRPDTNPIEVCPEPAETWGVILLVAHNARVFDVPFLVNEFNRCNFEIPSDC